MGTKNLSVYVIITARPLFRGCATPRGLSELTDDDDESEKQKNVHFMSRRRAHAHVGCLIILQVMYKFGD